MRGTGRRKSGTEHYLPPSSDGRRVEAPAASPQGPSTRQWICRTASLPARPQTARFLRRNHAPAALFAAFGRFLSRRAGAAATRRARRPGPGPASHPVKDHARRRRPPASRVSSCESSAPQAGAAALRTCDFFSWRFDSVELALAATLAASPLPPLRLAPPLDFPISLRCKGCVCRCSAASVQREQPRQARLASAYAAAEE